MKKIIKTSTYQNRRISDSSIAFDIQVEILKKLPLKPLITFRSVSKQYKSLINSPTFIAEYGVRDSRPHRLLVKYTHYEPPNYSERYVCFLDNDDDDSNFTRQEFAPRVPNVLTKPIVGSSHGLFCLYNLYYNSTRKQIESNMVILWNPSTRKSIAITLPGELGWPVDKCMVFGFGVCPVTSDPIVVKSISLDGWQVEFFTLSSGIWKTVPSRNLPSCESVQLTWRQVVIDRFIYFFAYEKIVAMEGDDKFYKYLCMIVSFDMTTKEFTILVLPDNLTYRSHFCLTLSKIRESLVVLEYNYDMYKPDCVVWMMMMEQGVKKSFTKLFTIHTPVMRVQLVLGFKKNGDPIIVTEEDYEPCKPATLKVYERCSQHVKHLGIYGEQGSFFMGSYMDTLLLLDQPNRFIY